MRISWIAVIFAVVVLATLPAEGSCLDDRRVHSGTSGIWTAGSFENVVYSYYGPTSYDGPALTSSATGFFWAIGTGNPAVGTGDDSGSTSHLDWIDEISFPAYSYYTAQPIDFDWSDPGVDGCVDSAGATTALDGDECVALVIADLIPDAFSWPTGPSTMMLASAQVDPAGDVSFEQAGAHLELQPIPKPPITHTQSIHPSSLEIWTGPPPAFPSTHEAPSCPPAIIGHRIFVNVHPRGNPPPTPEIGANNWTLVAEGAGPGGLRPVDEAFSFIVSCEFPKDIYLGIQWVFDGGFAAPYLSTHSSRIKCGDGCTNMDLDPHCESQDCDDFEPGVYPGAPQTCDGLNNDCDDPGWPAPPTDELDLDLDGFAPCAGDCDDSNASIAPGAVELCNGIDDNCDGKIDEDPLGLDTDSDTIGDSCDNCVSVPDRSQADRDADSEGDVCDLDDGSLHVWFDGTGSLGWQNEAGLGPWNVYRGDLATLRSGGEYTQLPGANPVADRFCDLPGVGMADGWTPGTGSFAFYLVTGDQSGVEIDLGQDGGGAARPNTHACP